MKLPLRESIIWIAALLVLFTSSCSSDDGPSSDEPQTNLVGKWYGTRYYMNNGTIKYQYLTLELNSDRTGSMEYEAPGSFSAAKFQWSVSGNKLICQGAYADTYGDVSGDYRLECRIEGDRLYPADQFSVFVLTQDNSIMTDGNGTEVLSPDEQAYILQNVWVSTDKKSIIEFYPGGSYDEYILTSPGANSYSEFNTGKYLFMPLEKLLRIDGVIWDVVSLNSDYLEIKRGSKSNKYTMGSRDDIPDQVNLKELLLEGMTWCSSKNIDYIFTFTDGNKVTYIESSGKRYGSYNQLNLRADGTFSVNGSKVTCYFSDVFWDFGTGNAADCFPGWTCGKPCTKQYIMEVTPSGSIMTTLPDSKVIYLEKI